MRRSIQATVAAAAVIVVAVPAASAGDGIHDTKLSITHEGGWIPPDDDPDAEFPGHYVLWHGRVDSGVEKCMDERRVVLFKKRDGRDRKLGAAISDFRADYGRGEWGVNAPMAARATVYARVMRESGNGYVCLADRAAHHHHNY